jgi:hypothetical protein
MGSDWRRVTRNATNTRRPSYGTYMLARVAQGSNHCAVPPGRCEPVTAPASRLFCQWDNLRSCTVCAVVQLTVIYAAVLLAV